MLAGESSTHHSADQSTPNDPTAYRIAIASFGLALVAFVIMAGLAVVGNVTIPDKFWVLGTSIAAVLMGILAPPTQAKQADRARKDLQARADLGDPRAAAALEKQEARTTQRTGTKFWAWVLRHWPLIILGAVFVVCGGLGLWFSNANYTGAAQLFAAASAAAAAFLGYIVPSPKSKS